MDKFIVLIAFMLCAVSCSKQETPSSSDTLEAKRKLAQKRIQESESRRKRAMTVDEFFAYKLPMVKSEERRLELAWEIKRIKQLLKIFTGDDGSKLLLEDFTKAAEKLSKNPVEANPNEEVITKTYADYINWFAFRNDVPPYKVLRYDYMLKNEGLNLLQLDLLFYRMGVARNKALGKPVDSPQPQSNVELVPIKSGLKKPKQSATLTEEEQSFVKLCKTVVNEVWKE